MATIDSVRREYREAILDGMARSLWVSSFANWATDIDPGEDASEWAPEAGQDWDDVAPQTPAAALQAATELEEQIAKIHDEAPDDALVNLFEVAVTIDRDGDPYNFDPSATQPGLKDEDGGTELDLAMSFGHYLAMMAMMAMGEGVSWFDDHKERRGVFDRKWLALPHFEIYYDGVWLNWTGGDAVATRARPINWQRRHFVLMRVVGGDDELFTAQIDRDDARLDEKNAINEALSAAMESVIDWGWGGEPEGSGLEYAIVQAPTDGEARDIEPTSWIAYLYRRIRVSFSEYTPESLDQGDASDTGWVNEDGVPIADAQAAIRYLRDEGANEPSSSPFSPGTWYTHHGEMHSRTGVTLDQSYHPVNFPEDEQREIYKAVTGRGTKNPKGRRNPHQVIFHRILLIEDDPAVQRAMQRLIKGLYPQAYVITVDNATDAIESIQATIPDLILSDYDIKGSTGGDVLAYLRKTQSEAVRRFLFVSGNDIVSQLHDHHVEKPATKVQIQEAIEKLLAADPMVALGRSLDQNPGRARRR